MGQTTHEFHLLFSSKNNKSLVMNILVPHIARFFAFLNISYHVNVSKFPFSSVKKDVEHK